MLKQKLIWGSGKALGHWQGLVKAALVGPLIKKLKYSIFAYNRPQLKSDSTNLLFYATFWF